MSVVACGDDDGPATAGPSSGGAGGSGGKGMGGTPSDGGRSGDGGGKITGGSGGKLDNPDVDVPPDADDCSRCSSELTPARSLECYCTAHECAPTLAAALQNPRWYTATKGCDIVYLRTGGGVPPTGYLDVFDANTGALVGASTWEDTGSGCFTPTATRGTAVGGRHISMFDDPPACSTGYESCRLKDVTGAPDGGSADGGTDAGAVPGDPPSWWETLPPCDLSELVPVADGG